MTHFHVFDSIILTWNPEEQIYPILQPVSVAHRPSRPSLFALVLSYDTFYGPPFDLPIADVSECVTMTVLDILF